MRLSSPVLALAVLLTGVLALAAAPRPAAASGVTTHAFMAEAAIPFVRTPALRQLLEAHRDELLSGAHYPDGGYGSSSLPGGDYGEVSHWERFVRAYVRRLGARTDCAPLAAPAGPCAAQVAHLLGTAAHGIGDERWDWLFEPKLADFGESPVHPGYAALSATGLPGAGELAALPPGQFINTPEFALDNIGLVEHGRLRRVPRYAPPVDDLLAVYRALGRDDVTADGIRSGHAIITAAALAERAGTAAEYPRVKVTMPTAAAQYVEGSGGVLDVARAAAGYYEAVWTTLTTGTSPAPQVVGVHPQPGETGVPTAWHPVRAAPGPSGGGAENRILASISTALQEGTVDAGSFRLLGPGGRPVPQEPGFPKAGPYGYGDGAHTFLAWPAADLAPCTTYTAEVTTRLRDHAGGRLRAPYRWSFTTRAAPGATCPPGPPTTGPQLTQDAIAPDGHAHGVPATATVAIRRLARTPGRGDVLRLTLSCIGPGDCRGRTGLLARAGARSFSLGARPHRIRELRTQVLSFRLPPAARAALRRRGRLAVDVRILQRGAASGQASTTTRRFVLRQARPRR
ncbi:Ig-like domain-containing protein [Paraconexibacter algicola]|uniref:SbsA Ig-like domain-containing protein n=1 Tax=Paraconexibacter algicola TaxID=2133960 RepID=A0A2T4UDJ3_9ACTN|nr:Ig-like domain-containing protein [Paraconexibacter algicola]PTL55545.1 hypothetical protein C7Y72_18030 [Paraconexibacter algicola]